MVRKEEGGVELARRRKGVSQKLVNMTEREAFMSGEKLVAVISEAASTGTMSIFLNPSPGWSRA
jgi:hypothetical protein